MLQKKQESCIGEIRSGGRQTHIFYFGKISKIVKEQSKTYFYKIEKNVKGINAKWTLSL